MLESEFRADLHCHSNCSDGSDAPERLLSLAKEAGLQGLSITDHDTIDVYTPSLFSRAEELGLRLLTGVELSTEFERSNIHVLGYGIDVFSPSFKEFLAELQQQRTARNKEILHNLERKNMPISEEELMNSGAKHTIGRPHIALLMVKKGYARTFQEAFDVYLKEGGSCYVQGMKFTPADAIRQIHQAEGKAILAHPHFLPKGSVRYRILSNPFDGIECYYARLPKEQELPWVELAEKRGWIVTGGSDYHGMCKPEIPLGSSWTNEATFLKLFS